MKASYEVLQKATHSSFLVKRLDVKAFPAPYHFHPEYELTWIIEGEGKRYVGNTIEQYKADDFILLGPNLPHCWKSENLKKKTNAKAIVVQFLHDFMGTDFFSKPELLRINKLLQRSTAGIKCSPKQLQSLKSKLTAISQTTNTTEKLLALLQILDQLSSARDHQYLTKNNSEVISYYDKERVQPVLTYIVENFRKQVRLEDAASIANMSIHSFCKYFKKTTSRTFIETVNDYRIQYAVQQLINTQKSVEDIAYESGFNDVSHFFKTFKNKNQISPLHYRKSFQ